LAADWEANGADVIRIVRLESPEKYLAIAAALVPKSVALAVETPGPLSPADNRLLAQILIATRQAIPHANDMESGAVLAFVRDAILAHRPQRLIDNGGNNED
jgi:hypothetical protein